MKKFFELNRVIIFAVLISICGVLLKTVFESKIEDFVEYLYENNPMLMLFLLLGLGGFLLVGTIYILFVQYKNSNCKNFKDYLKKNEIFFWIILAVAFFIFIVSMVFYYIYTGLTAY